MDFVNSYEYAITSRLTLTCAISVLLHFHMNTHIFVEICCDPNGQKFPVDLLYPIVVCIRALHKFYNFETLTPIPYKTNNRFVPYLWRRCEFLQQSRARSNELMDRWPNNWDKVNSGCTLNQESQYFMKCTVHISTSSSVELIVNHLQLASKGKQRRIGSI